MDSDSPPTKGDRVKHSLENYILFCAAAKMKYLNKCSSTSYAWCKSNVTIFGMKHCSRTGNKKCFCLREDSKENCFPFP